MCAILFENTMDRDVDGQPSAQYLWNVKRVVPILKIDKGLVDENDGAVHVGDLSPKRDFADVRDVARGYRLLALHGESGQAYNLASGQSVSIQHILDLLCQMGHTKVEVHTDPDRLRKTEVMDVRGSYEKFKERCGWEPQIPLEKTLRDLLNHHRDRILREAGSTKTD